MIGGLLPATVVGAGQVPDVSNAVTPAPGPRVFARLATERVRPTVRQSVLPDLPAEISFAEAGVVDVCLVVSAQGAVVLPRIIAGLDDATNAAVLEAVALWSFEPARVNGQRTATLILARFMFTPSPTAGEPPSIRVGTGLLPAEPLPDRPDAFAAASEDATLEAPRAILSLAPDVTVLRRGVRASIVVELLIDPEGSVGATRIVQASGSSPELERAALIATRYLLFAPSLRNGEAVARRLNYTVNFEYR